jgi:hypothetical protein
MRYLAFLLIIWVQARLFGAATNGLVTFRTLGEGQRPYAGELCPEPVTTPAAWILLWTQFTGQTNCPAVDFSREMVWPITALLPSAGYRIGIETITNDGSQVCATATQLGQGQTNLAPAWTYHLVALASTRLPLNIEYRPRLEAGREMDAGTLIVLRWQGFDAVNWEGRCWGCSNVNLVECSDSLVHPHWTPVEGHLWQSEPRQLEINVTNRGGCFFRVRSRPVSGARFTMPLLGLGRQTGVVVLPAGMKADYTQLQVINSQDQVAVQSDGGFVMGTLAGGPMLATVLGPGGAPMLMGWLDVNHRQIDARTTAEVLVFFANGLFLNDETVQRTALDWLAESADLAPIVQAIETSLAANPASLISDNADVRSAISQVIGAMGVRHGLTAKPMSVQINPAAIKSGLRLDITPGVNTLRFVNTYRRRSHVFADMTF